MTHGQPTIFLSAAEASGDAHAAKLITSLRRKRPDVRIVGVGGPKMHAAGCEVACPDVGDITAHASMTTGPLFKLGYYRWAIGKIKRAIGEIRPDVHVPVDSPALNWHLAAAAKQSGAKVVYYIAPQVWAWAQWRIKKLKRLTDHVACILPFEQDWLRQRGIAATYVGHPLFDDAPGRPSELPDLMEAWTEGTWKVALLPGSRAGEISAHTRALAATAQAIQDRWPKASFTFPAVDERAAGLIRAQLGAESASRFEIAPGRTEQVLAQSHFAVAASGTITLEVAHFGVPMVIFYKVSRLMYNLLGRWLLKTPHLSLVNILGAEKFGRRIVPELMPWHGSAGQLSSMVLEVMSDLGWLLEARRELTGLADSLITPGASASDNAADLVIDALKSGEQK